MKLRNWRALAHIRRRIASATPIGAAATSRPRTIQRSGRRVSARPLRSSPRTHLAGASTGMRIEIDAARFGEIDHWTLERYKQSSKRGHHIPFRDCAERPLVVGIADAHGAVLDSPYSSADRGAVVIVLDEAKRSLHAELLGCRASDPGWWIARIYPAPMRPEMDRRSRLPSPRQHARGRDLVHDDSRGALVL